MPPKRLDGRDPDQPRPITFARHWIPSLPGSVLAQAGDTRVLCTAVVESGVPPFLQGTGEGWLTAEYAMLPASTVVRRKRDRAGRPDGRSVEIQRLIGRSLRAVVNRRALTGRTVWVDCDVLSADGGTRTTAINGAWVAVHDALKSLEENGELKAWPLQDSIQAIAVGLADGTPIVDLTYYEDSNADVDLNLVMTGSQKIVEINGGAERGLFDFDQFDAMVEVGRGALARVAEAQTRALAT